MSASKPTQRTFPVIATLMTLCGVIVLCSLGTWQIQRLAWKEALLTDITAQNTKAPRPFTSRDLTTENEFQTGSLTGSFLNDKAIRIIPRTYDGKPGAHIITPFQLNSGEMILINRGWLANNAENIKPNSARKIQGMIRTPQKSNPFTPENNTARDEWYAIDYAQIAQAKEINHLIPIMMYESCKEGLDVQPNPCALSLNINNNHAQYALFWFSMAGVLIVIYVLRFWRRVGKT